MPTWGGFRNKVSLSFSIRIMKPHVTLLIALAIAGPMSAGFAYATDTDQTPDPKNKASRIEVIFKDPEKFTDAKDGHFGSDKGRSWILDEIKSYIETLGDRYLPAGQKLQLTFTDVDLAGDFEPWRTPPADDIRIVKDIYPPRFEFTYKITDEKTGSVVKEGSENIRDLSFMSRLVIDRNDSLKYEKDMLKDWLRSELMTAKK